MVAADRRWLALAAREAQIVGINANLRSGDGNSSDAGESLTSGAPTRRCSGLRDRRGPNFDDLEIQTLVGFVHFTTTVRGSPKAMARASVSRPTTR